MVIHMKKMALAYLKRDNVLYMAMIFLIEQGLVDIIYAAADGVFIKETDGNVFMISADSFAKGKNLLDRAGKPTHICAYRKDIADYLYEKYGYKKYVENVQAVYMKTERAAIESRSLDIRPLTLQHLDWIHRQYSAHLDCGYLKKRLERGAIYGGFVNDEICGFIGTHADGSIGIFKVLEKYRRRGFALELEAFLVNRLLDEARVPFSQIEHDNEASIRLHKKLGFEISKNTLYRLID